MSVATISQTEQPPPLDATSPMDGNSQIEKGSKIDQVRQWLLDYRPKGKEDHPEVVDLDLDLDLIENRVIDSLGFMNFVFFLEELTERELIAEAQSANSFRTLRIIQKEILQEAS